MLYVISKGNKYPNKTKNNSNKIKESFTYNGELKLQK